MPKQIVTSSASRRLSIYGSISYNHSVYADTITCGGTAYPLVGKYVVNDTTSL